MTTHARFDAKYVSEPNTGCWLWMGGVSMGGYGNFLHEGRQMGAHRVSWMIHNGPIPDGLWVLHRCDTPPCVNPAHLFLGDHVTNMADSKRKGRTNRGERHYGSKLTEAQMFAIKAALGEGAVGASLAREYGVSPQAISDIGCGNRWQYALAETGEQHD